MYNKSLNVAHLVRWTVKSYALKFHSHSFIFHKVAFLKLSIITKAKGGWDFHFEATEEEARKILTGSVGEQIELDGDREVITLDRDSIGHSMKKGEGSTYESLVTSNVKSQIRKMLTEGAWDEE